MSFLNPPVFTKDIPHKISNKINVSGKNTLIKTCSREHVAIADGAFDAKVDGKKIFCARVDYAGSYLNVRIGFTPMEAFDSTTEAWFGGNGFTACGMDLFGGYLRYPVNEGHNIIDWNICDKAKEIIVILTISNNGKKKEIRFLVDGNESKSSDVSEFLKGDFLFPAIGLASENQQITTIPIDQITKRTPEIENLMKEYQQQQQQQQQRQQQNQIPLLPSVSNEINNQVISQFRQQINDDQRILIQEKDKQVQEMRRNLEAQAKNSEIQAKNFEEQLKHARLQLDEFRKDFLKQLEISRTEFLRELQLERETSNKQLELERAENQQLRNLLQHKKDEMSAMEIYYLKRESGQRREREEETEFKVKEEPQDDEDEKPIQQNNKKNKNKKQSKN
jgi:hypothetical protein